MRKGALNGENLKPVAGERLGSKQLIGGRRGAPCETNSAIIKWQAEDFLGM